MNPFLREHVRPLIGSALLHCAVAAGAVAAAWFSVAPKIVQPQAIEAYLAPAPRAHAGAVPEAAPEPAPAPAEPTKAEPPAPDSAVAEREQHAAEVVRLEQAAAAKAAADATRRLAAEREAKRKADTTARREAELKAKHKADAAAKHKAEVEAKAALKRRADDEARLREAVAKDKARLAAEHHERAARETDLARQLADEQHRLGAENAGLQARYVTDLRARIERAWNRPPTAKAGIRCVVDVTQVPGGTVTDVKVGECNGDSAVVESIKGAVFRASPLPPPPDPSLFERKLHLVFNPDG